MTQVKLITNGWAWAATVFSIPILGLMLFAVQQAMRGGVQISDRVRKAGGSVFLNQWVMEYGYWWLRLPVRLLVQYRVSPNTISLAGFAIVLGGCGFAAAGYFGLAGPLLLVGSLSDMLDGIVARERGLCSDAGEFVDSIVDRYADIALFGCLCFYYAGCPWAIAVVMLALTGSVMVSYGRAKAESLGVHNTPGGPMRRAERAVYLGFSILLAPAVANWSEPHTVRPMYFLVLSTCAVIGVLANLSAVQMTLFINHALRKKG